MAYVNIEVQNPELGQVVKAARQRRERRGVGRQINETAKVADAVGQFRKRVVF
jgi:hypothetical protein